MKRSLTLPWMLLSVLLPLTAQVQSSDLTSRELRLEIKQAEDRVGDSIDELEHRVENLELLRLLLGISVAGIIPAYWLLVRKTKKLVEEKIGSLIESHPRALLALIDERDADLRRRRETAILVVAETLETEGLLRGSGFSRVTTRKPTADSATARIDGASVVVFDLDSGCTEESASELIAGNNLEFFLVYTSGRSNLRGKSCTFANSPVTLFSRLTELIEYRYAVERELQRP